MYPYIFDITVIDEHDSVTQPTDYQRHSGIGFCTSVADAAAQLESDWGDGLISIKHLELLEENNEIFLPWDVLTNIMNDNYWEGIPCDGMGEKS